MMALRRALGWSDGELMRSDAKPCSRLMRQTAGIFTVGGALGFWILCRLHYHYGTFLLTILFTSLPLLSFIIAYQTSRYSLVKKGNVNQKFSALL